MESAGRSRANGGWLAHFFHRDEYDPGGDELGAVRWSPDLLGANSETGPLGPIWRSLRLMCQTGRLGRKMAA
jgi:hypothetical protein